MAREDYASKYRTARTVLDIGTIKAGTFVAVCFQYREQSTGRACFTISTKLFDGDVEHDVPETSLEKFCL